ncbi:hypothetical protein [Paludisphaera borealis]|uniref:Uncharacterized protein n=1 Tax=Paludisphaera borealis TaxID=1387353 RepID=A0A1U7CJK1_9BACT|nr:hypothetical protein [Paludisphaera borealis]APW59115.1 hypothetical protein BSF38_00529 [Paludisphaera borealis]MDR3621787.1 hypothetical protein [Paludisphaera borealis]
MRLRGPVIACMLVGLGVSSERAVANGIIVVPVVAYYPVLRTGIVQQAPASAPVYKGHLHRLCKPGAAPVYTTATYYELAPTLTKIVIPNPTRPCYTPPPTPTPQSLPAPAPQSPHDHATPSAQAPTAGESKGCGKCWPLCFMVEKELRCMCCVHYTRHVAAGTAEAIDLANQANAQQVPYLFGDHPYVAAAIADAVEAPDPIKPTPPPAKP